MIVNICIYRLSYAASDAIERIKDSTRKGITAAVEKKAVASLNKQTLLFLLLNFGRLLSTDG